MISESNFPIHSFHTPVKFLWTEFRGVKIENPSALISVSLEDTVRIPEARLWIGSETDRKLLSSSSWLLVDIEDQSRLVYANNDKFFNNFKRSVSKKIDSMPEENVLDISAIIDKPRLLIPREMAVQIGMSRLTDLGKVTQINPRSTYEITKYFDQPPSSSFFGCILYQNGQAYEIRHFLNSPRPQSTAEHLVIGDTEQQLDSNRIFGFIRSPFKDFFVRFIFILILLVFRLIFNLVCQKLGIFRNR